MPLIDEAVRQTGVGIIDLHAALSHRKELFPKGISIPTKRAHG